MKTLKQFLRETKAIDDLMKARAEWPSGYSDVARVEIEVPIDKLQATQKDVDSSIVSAYVKGHGDFQGQMPEVVLSKQNGKYLIIDGHHRVAAEILKGREKIKVELVGEI